MNNTTYAEPHRTRFVGICYMNIEPRRSACVIWHGCSESKIDMNARKIDTNMNTINTSIGAVKSATGPGNEMTGLEMSQEMDISTRMKIDTNMTVTQENYRTVISSPDEEVWSQETLRTLMEVRDRLEALVGPQTTEIFRVWRKIDNCVTTHYISQPAQKAAYAKSSLPLAEDPAITTRKLIHVGGGMHKYRDNIKWSNGRGQGTRRGLVNTQATLQGDGVKHKPQELSKQTFTPGKGWKSKADKKLERLASSAQICGPDDFLRDDLEDKTPVQSAYCPKCDNLYWHCSCENKLVKRKTIAQENAEILAASKPVVMGGVASVVKGTVQTCRNINAITQMCLDSSADVAKLVNSVERTTTKVEEFCNFAERWRQTVNEGFTNPLSAPNIELMYRCLTHLYYNGWKETTVEKISELIFANLKFRVSWSLLNGLVSAVFNPPEYVPEREVEHNIIMAGESSPTQVVLGFLSIFAFTMNHFLNKSVPHKNNVSNVMESFVNVARTYVPISLMISKGDAFLVGIWQLMPKFVMTAFEHWTPSFYNYVKFTMIDKKMINSMSTILESVSGDDTATLYDSHKLHNFILARASVEKNRGDLSTVPSLKVALEGADSLYSVAFDRGLVPGKRIAPFTVWISGPPGVGKTTLALNVAQRLGEKLFSDVPEHLRIFAPQVTNDFFSGYHNQPITFLNDYLKKRDGSEDDLLMGMNDISDLEFNTASVDNPQMGIKGEVRFTSQILIITSNVDRMHVSYILQNTEAFNRRRDIVLRVTRKKNTDGVVPHSQFEWANFTQLEPESNAEMRNETARYNLYNKVDVFLDVIEHGWREKHQHGLSIIQRPIIQSEDDIETVENPFFDAPEMSEDENRKYWLRHYTDLVRDFFLANTKWILGATILGVSAITLVKWCLSHPWIGLHSIPSGDEITRGYIPKRLRVIQSSGGDIGEFVTKVLKNRMFRVLTHHPTNDFESRGVNGIQIGESILLLPKHIFYRGEDVLPNGTVITVANGEIMEHCFFEIDRLSCSELDFCLYNFNGTLRRVPAILTQFVDSNTTIPLTEFNGSVVAYDREITMPLIFNTQIEVIKKNVAYYDEVKSGRNKTYNSKTLLGYKIPQVTVGDCGSIVVSGDTSINKKILGIHVSGGSIWRYGQIIRREEIIELMIKFKPHMTPEAVRIAPFSNINVREKTTDTPAIQGNFVTLCELGVGEIPFLNTKTDIVPSVFAGVLQEPITAPAVLSPNDKRMKIKVSPLEKATSKYGEVQYDIPFEARAFVREAMISYYEPLRNEEFSLLTEDEMINGCDGLEGINMQTSAGYQYVIKGMRKQTHLFKQRPNGQYDMTVVMKEIFYEYERALLQGDTPATEWMVCLKDERRELPKILDGKTRAFQIAPVEYNMVGRKYFGKFIRHAMRRRHDIGSFVGGNPYSDEFDQMYNRLKKFCKAFGGDVKAFDGKFLRWIFILFTEIISEFYDDEFADLRQTIIYLNVFSCMVYLNHIIVKTGGNSSGFFGTVIFNDFMMKAYIAFTYYMEAPTRLRTVAYFRDNHEITTYGDDHLVTVSDSICEYLNGVTVERQLAKLGIIYTTADKKTDVIAYTELEDLTFLKNNFIYHERTGTMVAGLDKNVIQEMVSWTRDGTRESMQMTLNSCMRFAYFHGRNYYKVIYDKLQNHIRENKLQFILLRFETLEWEYINGSYYTEFIMDRMTNEQLNIMMKRSNENKRAVTSTEEKNMIQGKDAPQHVEKGNTDKVKITPSIERRGVAIADQGLQKIQMVDHYFPNGKLPDSEWTTRAMGLRPQVLGKVTWATSDVIGTTTTFTIPDSLLSVTMMKAAAETFLFERATLHVRFTVQSANFYQGLAIVHMDYGLNTLGTVTGAYLRHHVLIDAKANSASGELVIPYRFYHNYIDPQSTELGELCFTVVSPLFTGASGPTGIDVLATMWTEDLELRIPRTTKISIASGEGLDRNVIHGFSLFDNSTHNHVTTLENIENASLPQNITGDQFDLKNDLKVSAMDRPTDPNDQRSLKIENVGTMVGNKGISYIRKLNVHPDETNEITIRDAGTGEDEMALSTIFMRQHAFGDITITSADTFGQIVANYPVAPFIVFPESLGTSATGRSVNTMEAVAGWFDFWSGDLIYNFKIVASAYHSARLFIGVTFDNVIPSSFDDLQSGFGTHVDINGENSEVELYVPFVSPTNWKYVYAGNTVTTARDYICGRIYVVVEAPLVSPASVQASVALIITVRGGENFCVARPGMRNLGITSIQSGSSLDRPRVLEKVEEADEDSATQDVALLKPVNVYHGGIKPVKSFRDVLSTYSHCGSLWAQQDLTGTGVHPHIFGFTQLVGLTGRTAWTEYIDLATSTLATFPDMIDQVSRLYVGWRGSIRYKLQGTVTIGETISEALNIVPAAGKISVYVGYPDSNKYVASITSVGNTINNVRNKAMQTYVYASLYNDNLSTTDMTPIRATPVAMALLESGSYSLEFEVPFYSIHNYDECLTDKNSLVFVNPCITFALEGNEYLTGDATIQRLRHRAQLYRAIGDDFRFVNLNESLFTVAKPTTVYSVPGAIVADGWWQTAI